MNPWELFWLVVAWTFSGIVAVLVLVFALAVLVGVVRGVRGWFKPKPEQPKQEP